MRNPENEIDARLAELQVRVAEAAENGIARSKYLVGQALRPDRPNYNPPTVRNMFS